MDITKNEHIKFTIERFDHSYDSVNNKGAFYIGLNTFILSGVSAGFLSLYSKLYSDILLSFLFISILICNISSIYFTIKAIMPFLKSKTDQNANPSLFYFGDVAKHTLSNYKERITKATIDNITDDLIDQAHCLATGLKAKYSNLKNAGRFVLFQFIIIIPLFLFTIQNLNYDISKLH
jgi:hypothetical protein